MIFYCLIYNLGDFCKSILNYILTLPISKNGAELNAVKIGNYYLMGIVPIILF